MPKFKDVRGAFATYTAAEHDARFLSKKEARHVASVLLRLEGVVGALLADEGQLSAGHFSHIPAGYEPFFEGLELAKDELLRQYPDRPAGPTFLDVGCGLGTKLHAAARVGFRPFGIDVNPRYVDIALQMGEQAAVADGRTFPHYADYDVVYWYTPMHQTEPMNDLERAIVAGVRPGCVLFPARGTLYVTGPDQVTTLRATSNEDLTLYVKK
jgi:SAM-dependent methyltransferase